MKSSIPGFSVLHYLSDLPKLMSIELVMPSNHLILCHPLLLLPSIFLSIRVFSNESVVCIRWPKYWNFSLSISPSNEYLGLIGFRTDWFISLLSKGLSRVFSSTTVWKHYNPTLTSVHDYWKNHSFDYRDQEKGAVTPQETESDLPVSGSLWQRHGSTVACCGIRVAGSSSPGCHGLLA